MHLLDLFGVYATFFFYGYWVYAFVFRRVVTPAGWRFLLPPLFGLSTIAIYSQNIIALSLLLSSGMLVFSILTLLLNAAGLWIERNFFTSFVSQVLEICPSWQTAKQVLIANKYSIAVAAWIAAVSLAVMGPILGLGLTTPWRIGPDAAGYTNLASFLVGGGTMDQLDGKFNVPQQIYVYEFWLQGFRRAGGGIISFLSLLFDRHPSELSFIICAFCLLMCALAVFYLAQQIFDRKHRFLCSLVAAAVALNCNLLFILYEGSYLQIMSMPLIVLIILLVRSSVLDRLPVIASATFYGCLLAAMSAIYPEALVIFPMLLGGFAAADFFLKPKLPRLRNFLIICGSIIVAFALNYDALLHWLAFEKENSNLVALAGWPQPEWAFFPQIMGWIDIYRHVRGNVPTFTNAPFHRWIGLSLGMSGLLFITITMAYFRRSRSGVMAVIPLMMTVMAYLYFRHIIFIHNYSYMKIYTIVLPLMYVGIIGCIISVFGSRIGTAVTAALSVLTIVTGILFIIGYRANYNYVTPGMLELQNLATQAKLDNYILLPAPDDDQYHLIRDIFLRSLYTGKMIHTDFVAEQDFSASRRLPVALLVHYRGQPQAAYKNEDILWKGSEYMVLNTHLPVEGIWKNGVAIPWSPQPNITSRPEIELRWTHANEANNIANQIDFAPYYARATVP